MLVLGRKVGEAIVVPGCDLTITVVQVSGNKVRLGMSAPDSVVIHRKEVWQRDMLGTEGDHAPKMCGSRQLARAPR